MFIKNAAVRFENNIVVEGLNYASIFSLADELGVYSAYTPGFVDSHGNFIDRNVAADIAVEAGQVPDSFSAPLYPEDLLPEMENDCAS